MKGSEQAQPMTCWASGGADHGAQVAAGHGGLDLAALLGGEGAVVEGDGEVVVVDGPQLLEDELGLPAGVDENQAHAGAAKGFVDLGDGVLAGMAGPGDLALGDEDVDHRRRAGVAADDGDCGGGGGASFSPRGRWWAAKQLG